LLATTADADAIDQGAVMEVWRSWFKFLWWSWRKPKKAI